MSDAPRLKAKYLKDIVPSLTTEFKYSNPHQVPKLEKIVVNMGVGEAARDSKVLEGAVADMAIITGQKPQITKAKKSIAQFKLREGQAIGCFVTLRGDRSSSTVCSRPPFRAFAISGDFLPSSLTATATTPSA